MGTLQFLFLRTFLLVLTKFPFWFGGWSLGYNLRGFGIFLIFPNFLRPLVFFFLCGHSDPSIGENVVGIKIFP